MSKPVIFYARQIEGVEGALPCRLGAVCAAVLSCAVTALVLGSNAVLNWANNLPISPASDVLLQAAQSWANAMTAIGLGHVSTTLNGWLTAFQSLHWWAF